MRWRAISMPFQRIGIHALSGYVFTMPGNSFAMHHWSLVHCQCISTHPQCIVNAFTMPGNAFAMHFKALNMPWGCTPNVWVAQCCCTPSSNRSQCISNTFQGVEHALRMHAQRLESGPWEYRSNALSMHCQRLGMHWDSTPPSNALEGGSEFQCISNALGPMHAQRTVNAPSTH